MSGRRRRGRATLGARPSRRPRMKRGSPPARDTGAPPRGATLLEDRRVCATAKRTGRRSTPSAGPGRTLTAAPCRPRRAPPRPPPTPARRPRHRETSPRAMRPCESQCRIGRGLAQSARPPRRAPAQPRAPPRNRRIRRVAARGASWRGRRGAISREIGAAEVEWSLRTSLSTPSPPQLRGHAPRTARPLRRGRCASRALWPRPFRGARRGPLRRPRSRGADPAV
mmetsp:Transcript_5246/g.18622  ORF Transcript_5246/g.18622 Transcript_5246/m.18622 type:complete len:225 (+) Transcript_5246:3174-3848(+)